MPSQYAVDIPFTASHDQQLFKMIELPPDLLALLESQNKPTLTITSSPPSATAPGHALLNTGTKSYQMRQKNTSNPVMLLRPSFTGPAATDDPATFIPEPSICSIAKIQDTLELIPQEPEVAEKALPKANKWHETFVKSKPRAK